MLDYIQNGQGYGAVGERLASSNFDPGLLRPFIDESNHRCVTVNTGRREYDPKTKSLRPVYEKARINDLRANGMDNPVWNATTMRKEEWIELDRTVLRAARLRLRAWSDLASRNTYGGFNAMGKTVLEFETMSDPGEAVVDMDALSEGRNDRPSFQLQGLPLPITHSDFSFSARMLAASRNSNTPLDTTLAEAAGRRVAEMIEKTTIGTNQGITYGGANTQPYGRSSSVYGYTNFPPRLTYVSLTAPTTGGWVGATLLKQILAMRDLLYLSRFFGPFMVYTSNDWDAYLDNDYILTGGNVATQTMRERIRNIDGILDVKRLDFLFASNPSPAHGPGGEGFTATATSPFTILMVQMTPDVARAVNGMDITTVQWESKGGLEIKFKCLAIQVPQLRADYYGNCGLAHGTTA